MTASPQSIEIIGGGLSGLLLGILLRRGGIPCTLHEAGQYPRHRVCGEFLSGDGVEVLRRCDLLDPLLARGARWASSAAFYSESETLQEFTLPRPAFCLSRFAMDEELARIFEESGGILHQGSRVREGTEETPGVVLAAGRRRRIHDDGWRWFGLKVHAKNLPLRADLEMHLLENGYIGACRIEKNRVNLCGLFRRRVDGTDALPRHPESLLRGPHGSLLREICADAIFLEETKCAVAALDLRPHTAAEDEICRVGDALTMIPPLTGNGMSMALESAASAAPALARYSRGEVDWATAVDHAGVRLDRNFSSRLNWARFIQQGLFSPVARPLLLTAGRFCPPMWSFGFQKTR